MMSKRASDISGKPILLSLYLAGCNVWKCATAIHWVKTGSQPIVWEIQESYSQILDL